MNKIKWLLFLNIVLLVTSNLFAHEFLLNGNKMSTDQFLADQQDYNEYVSYLKQEQALNQFLQTYIDKKDKPAYLQKLAPPEVSAIQAYTDDRYYRKINDTFNGGHDLKANADVRLLIKLIFSGLNKIPSYDQGFLYRGLGWWETAITHEKYVANYKSYYDKLFVGTELSFPFMSTTKDDTTVFVRCTPVMFRIVKSQNGKDISEISTRPDQKEVLFRPFSKFKVINKFTRKLEFKDSCVGQTLDFDDQMVVDLEEVENNS